MFAPRSVRLPFGRLPRLAGTIVLAFGVLSGAAAVGEPPVSKEYQLKAAFLYNFTKFVEWPSERFADGTSPIVIGVLDRNPFGDELEKIVKGRTVNGRPIVIRLVVTVADAAAVHLLFVPAEEEIRPATMAAWKKAAVVSVGESERFAALGGTITFRQETDKVRFAINLESAEGSGLKISAQLLKLAAAVHRKS